MNRLPSESGFAFPKTKSAIYPSQDGMTLRAYVATAVLQGMNAAWDGEKWPEGEGIKIIAMRAVQQADALIAELNKEAK